MADFTWIADYDAGEDSTPRVLTAQFGDGYKQRAADGLNALLRTWNWSFNNRSAAETMAIIAFLKSKNGVMEFTHDLPDSSPVETVSVICPSWSRKWVGFDTYNVTAKFEEVVTIGV